MPLITFSKVEHDFPGGIYLPPLGQSPPLDTIETVDYHGDLRLPLRYGSASAMQTIFPEGASLSKAHLLAENKKGHCLYTPRAGIIGPATTATVNGRAAQPVLLFHPVPTDTPNEKLPAQGEPSLSHRNAKYDILKHIEQAGLVIPATGMPLAQMLRRWKNHKVDIVVANATPLEPELNTPLAILHHWPGDVFAGLAILKTFLDADEAVVAYPFHFPIDTAEADTWEVRCAAVSEKYPQGRSSSVVHTLQKQGHLPQQESAPTILVFEVQLLRQVERAVLGGRMPTDRIVTIAGDGITHPAHFIAPIGLPVAELLRRADCYRDTAAVIEGSSMVGHAIDPATAVVSQTSQYFTAVRTIYHAPPQRCIRCGWCISHCPAKIDPARLLQLAETSRYDQAEYIGAHRCVECGICSYLCPSSLRIMDHIIMIKRKLQSPGQSQQQ